MGHVARRGKERTVGAVKRMCLEIARCSVRKGVDLQASAGDSWGDKTTKDSFRRCGGDSSVIDDRQWHAAGRHFKQETKGGFALVDADKGLHRIFTAQHSEHEEI